MSGRTIQTQAVTLAERFAAHDRQFARYQRYASEVIADAGVLNINSDVMDDVFERIGRTNGEKEALRVWGAISDRTSDSDKETKRLVFELETQIGSAVFDERERAYLLGLAVGLELANGGKGGAR